MKLKIEIFKDFSLNNIYSIMINLYSKVQNIDLKFEYRSRSYGRRKHRKNKLTKNVIQVFDSDSEL